MRRITTAAPQLVVGDHFTLSVPEFDRRHWPRFVAWVLRRPRPVRNVVREFVVRETVTSTRVDLESA